MLHRPAFRPHWHVAIVSDQEVYLITEGRNVVLTGPAYVALARLIDGKRTTDAIVDEVADSLAPTDIYLALLNMRRDGYLEEQDRQLLNRTDGAFWGLHGVDQPAVVDIRASKSVAVRTVGDVDPDPIRKLLCRSGFAVVPAEDALATLLVVVTDDYLQPALATINAEMLELRIPWLLVKPGGLLPWVGPLFEPGSGPCWACLAQRLSANRDAEELARRASGSAEPFVNRAASPATVAIAAGLATTELARFLIAGNTTLNASIVTVNSLSLELDRHTVVRRPQCPACGDPDLTRQLEPVVVRSRLKAYTDDGGHRAMSPEAALKAVQHHVSSITGAVRTLTRITAEDDLLHVYLSGANLALRTENSQVLKRNVRGSNCGKGVTDAQARMSAVGESIERYSGVYRGEEISERGSFRQLGDRAIDPRTWMLYSEAQYASRNDWNARERRLDVIPVPFDEDAEIDWTPVWSLTRGEHRLLPTALCYYSTPVDPRHGFFLPESNGAAAGSSLEDAMLQGLMELVERDSVAIWWYNRLPQPEVDLDSFDEPYIRKLRQAYARLGRNIWVLDLTSDLGIPSFIAVSRRIDGHPSEDIVFAPAAHLDARIALLRALTELNQMIPGVATPEGKTSGYNYTDHEAVHWWQTATTGNQPWLLPTDDGLARRRVDFPQVTHDDLRDDIAHVRLLLESRGLEVLALDQTRLDVGVPVIKTIVPGLRHFWARFAPGRLYDVPVTQGRLGKATAEEDLNPIPIFI